MGRSYQWKGHINGKVISMGRSYQCIRTYQWKGHNNGKVISMGRSYPRKGHINGNIISMGTSYQWERHINGNVISMGRSWPQIGKVKITFKITNFIKIILFRKRKNWVGRYDLQVTKWLKEEFQPYKR